MKNGYKHSELTKKKISLSHIGMKTHLGFKHSEESKQKISLGNIGKKHTEEFKQRQKLNRLGKKASPETIQKMKEAWTIIKRQKQSKIMKGFAESLIIRSIGNQWGKANLGHKHTEKTIQKIREERSKQIMPTKDTKPERMVQISLALEGIKFEKHKLIKNNDFYHRVDIFIEPNICIEIDGDYWHSLQNVIKRDVIINKQLRDLGNIIIRIPEKHIINRKNRKRSIFLAQNYINYIKQLTKNNTIKKQDILIYPKV